MIFENNGLDGYIHLIALLSKKDVDLDLFRDEGGEERALRIFEEYVNGGLAFLMEKMAASLHQDPEQFLLSILRDRGVKLTAVEKSTEKKSIKLFS